MAVPRDYQVGAAAAKATVQKIAPEYASWIPEEDYNLISTAVVDAVDADIVRRSTALAVAAKPHDRRERCGDAD